ncbi:MAG: protein kinase domain-containing protein [Bradymonadia bacterium]
MSRIGQTVGNKFTLEELIGRSELGTVYKAKTASNKSVALKVLHDDLDETFTKTLLSNAKVLSQLRHQRIARILGAKFSKSQDTYIVHEWLGGSNLADMVRNTGVLTPDRAANLMIQLCSALSVFHGKGLPHANLKPSNVFVDLQNGEDSVTVVDGVGPNVLGSTGEQTLFGLAKHLAPEQLEQRNVGVSCDYFALGVLGYYLVSGKYPFAAPTPRQTADRVKAGKYRPLGELNESLDKSFITFVETCLKVDPTDRFHDLRAAAEKLSEVNALHDSEPKRQEEQDPDATMAFTVPEELQAFFDEQELDQSAATDEASPKQVSDTAAQRDSTSVGIEAPFFTDTDDVVTNGSDMSQDLSMDYASMEMSLGPNQEMNDDLPFHSVEVSQSALDQEISIIEEYEPTLEEKNDAAPSLSNASPSNKNDGVSPAEKELETDDIMEALRSTMEAVGPLDFSKQSVADAPVMAVSDFKELATDEFNRKASNENRFLSTKAQTGLKRPIFTMFLLCLLALAALVFQQGLQEEEEADRQRLQKVREQRIRSIKRAERDKAKQPKPKAEVKKVEGTPEAKAPATGRPEVPSSSVQKPQKPKVQQTPDSTPSTELKGSKASRPKPKRKAPTRNIVRPKAKKAPKVEIVDPFASP